MHLAVRLFTWCWITLLISGGTHTEPSFLPACSHPGVCGVLPAQPWGAARLSLPVELARPVWPTSYWRYPTSCEGNFLIFSTLDCGLSALQTLPALSYKSEYLLHLFDVRILRRFLFVATYVDSQLRPRVVGTTFRAPAFQCI